MYLLINNEQYPVTKRIVTKDTVKYLSVSPEPPAVSGPVQMYRDDGFLLAEDDSENYSRQTYAGTILTLTNKPEPTPVETVHVPTDGEVLNTLLGV